MTSSHLELAVALLALSWAVIAVIAFGLRTRLMDGVTGRSRPSKELAVGIGVVRAVDPTAPDGDLQVTLDVEAVPGQPFTGQLSYPADDPVAAALRPGSVVLVAFDPVAQEQLSLPEDMVAVRAAFDRMLIRKGLTTAAHLDLIRHGVRTRCVVTAVRPTGVTREDHREVEFDLMVRRPGGGQFPAHERALIPESAVASVGPGSIVDAYYRTGDESAIAVCIPPG